MARINEEIVLNYYLEMMDEDRVEFLKGKSHVKDKIRVCIDKLKKEDQIHNRIGVAKELWKILFEAAMSHIHADKMGYDDLFSFFDKYVEFEELIFATDSFYRDHTLHCLWVYFLGEYIYYKEEFYIVARKGDQQGKEFIKFFSSLSKDEEVIEKIGKEAQKTFLALEKLDLTGQSVRCISALTHDLGYPIKKINRINASIGKILPNFSIKTFSEFDFKYNNEQVQFIKTFIDFIGDEIHMIFNTKGTEDIKEKLKLEGKETKALQIEKDYELYKSILKEAENPRFIVEHRLKHIPAQRLRYANDFEKYQHGIMSAYLLMNTLRSFKTMNFTHKKDDEIDIDMDNLPSLGAKQDILKAISDHTSEGFTIKQLSGASEYLTFIDELEEFSRISRGNQYRQYINEFCETDLYTKEDVFHIDFIFNNEKITSLDPERAFKGRCKRFLSLFDIPKLSDDVKLHVRIISQLDRNNSTYELIIRRNFAQILIDGQEQSIPEYLKSRDFSSREEYALMSGNN